MHKCPCVEIGQTHVFGIKQSEMKDISKINICIDNVDNNEM